MRINKLPSNSRGYWLSLYLFRNMSEVASQFSRRTARKESIPPTLEEIFIEYCKQDAISREMEVDLMPLSQSDKWFLEAKIIDGHDITTTDTGLCFFKFRKRALTYNEYLEFLAVFAESKNLDVEEIKNKLLMSGKPNKPEDKKKKKSLIL